MTSYKITDKYEIACFSYQAMCPSRGAGFEDQAPQRHQEAVDELPDVGTGVLPLGAKPLRAEIDCVLPSRNAVKVWLYSNG
jgi:hypothetical protein